MANTLTKGLALNQEPTRVLNAIKELESSSGTDPKAKKPNKVGALGNYQLTPTTYLDVQSMFPEFKNISFERAALEEGLDRKAAHAALIVKAQRLSNLGVAPTIDAVVQAYHSGEGAVKTGKIGKYGKQYMKDFISLVGGTNGQD